MIRSTPAEMDHNTIEQEQEQEEGERERERDIKKTKFRLLSLDPSSLPSTKFHHPPSAEKFKTKNEKKIEINKE